MRILIAGGEAYREVIQRLGTALQTAGHTLWHLPVESGRWAWGEEMSLAILRRPYDVILGFCPYYWPAGLQEQIAEQDGALRVLWNFDDPHRILTWGDALARDLAPWQAVLTSSWEPWVAEWYAKAGRPALPVYPPGPAPSGGLREPWEGLCDVLFMGSEYSRADWPWQEFTRGELVEALRERGLRVTVYGDRFPAGPISWMNELPWHCSAAVNLGQHVRRALWLNFRDAMVPCAGGFYLCDDNPGTREIFGETVAYYSSPEEAADMASDYLAQPRERERMAQAAQRIAERNFGPVAIGKQFTERLHQLRCA